MMVWVRRHPKISVLILTVCIPAVYGSVCWIGKVDDVVDNYPATEDDIREIMVSNARLETDSDHYEERLSSLEENQADLLQAIPQIQTDLDWIKTALGWRGE